MTSVKLTGMRFPTISSPATHHDGNQGACLTAGQTIYRNDK